MPSRRFYARCLPYQGGGEMIGYVQTDDITYADIPHRFEAGTPAIVPAIGLGAAVQYMMDVGRENIVAYERTLLDYATSRLSELNSPAPVRYDTE